MKQSRNVVMAMKTSQKIYFVDWSIIKSRYFDKRYFSFKFIYIKGYNMVQNSYPAEVTFDYTSAM